MSGDYYCAHCEYEFVVEDGGDQPMCPKCGQTESVRSVDTFGLVRDIWRQWLVVLAILLLAGVGFVLYQWVRGR
ncbi:MAG: hypothetical protein OEM15_11250 [Myxococcales bacterium]|nr:hypothetical protein [Myxococcales bacterium]